MLNKYSFVAKDTGAEHLALSTTKVTQNDGPSRPNRGGRLWAYCMLWIASIYPMVLGAQGTSLKEMGQVKLGLQGGVMLNWLTTEQRLLNPGNSGLGATMGLSVSWPLAQRYAFQSGIMIRWATLNCSMDTMLYLQSGVMDTVLRPEYQYRVRGMEIPFLVRLGKVGAGKFSGLYGIFGLNTLWNFGVRARFDRQKEVLGYDEDEFFFPSNENYRPVNYPGIIVEPDDRIRFLQMMISVGGGWEFALNKELDLDLGFRYDMPMSQAFSGDYLKGRAHNFGLITTLNF